MPEQSVLHASGEGDGGPPEDKSESEVDQVEASEAEGARGFRVSVDLSLYWSAPAACLVWVGGGAGEGGAGARRVRWLARRVRRVARLRRPFCLLCGATALPPAEPLRMLRAGDQLRVVPVEHEWQQAFSFPAEAPSPDPVSLPEPIKKKHKSSQIDPEELARASPEPIRNHRSSHGELAPTPTLSDSPKKQKGSRAERASISPEMKQKRRKRNTLTETSPPPETEMQTEPVLPVECPPESASALERVKRRALALLQQVERGGDAPGGGAGGDAPDGGAAPGRRRRRRVRRRRAPDPSEPALEPPEPSAPAPLPANRTSPPGPAEPPAEPPALLRNPTPPRPPRLVRPLPAASAYHSHDTTEPERAATPPAPPAVTCN